ncbi:hypothetical protein [Nocardia nova]|uniref:hypothetical protein n=1 Tax=Nocardia nova TaxID=37330 RepID=UPI000CEA19D3|nr:hypothetical protein [Nocardia nova]PPI89241.1 hypothetical protein C5E46_34565 [Nocardia nova]
MARERVVDVYIPVVPSSAGVGGVGPMLVVPLVVVAVAVLVAVVVTVTHPDPHHTYYPRSCDPFCAAPSTTSVAVEGVTR